jgi:hypothetical protein
MKSDRRHELHTNELADWMSNLPEWWEQNSRTIIYVVAAVIVVFAVWYFAAVRTSAERTDQDQRLSDMLSSMENFRTMMANDPSQRGALTGQMMQLAGQLNSFADMASNPNAAALALLKSAEATRITAHYSPGVEDPEAEAKAVAVARERCLKAIQLVKDDSSLLAAAKIQLGLCQETLGQFDEAAKTYTEVISSPQFRGDVAIQQAQVRLASMGDFKAPVLLAPAPAPKPAAVTPAPDTSAVPLSPLRPQTAAPAPAPAPATAGTSTTAK